MLDCKEPAGGYRDFLMNEARYSRLTRASSPSARRTGSSKKAEKP